MIIFVQKWLFVSNFREIIFLIIFNLLKMAANFEIPRTNYMIVENNNHITQANYRRRVRYLSELSFAIFAMTESVILTSNLLRDFVRSANVVNVGQELVGSCTIQGRTIQITENI